MGEMVGFEADGRKTDGYLALPGSGRGPGVVVIQEWWGLVPQIKGAADRLAREGFVALVPDLFHGKTTASPDEAGKLMMALRIDEAEQDLRGAIRYLLAHEAVTGPEMAVRPKPESLGNKKVGTIGFCMGGALSLFAASKNAEVSACVVFYGGHPNVKPDLPNLQAPVLGLYAGNDGFVTPESVQALDAELTKLGKPHEFHTYPRVDHAFANETGKNYNKAAAEDAWRRAVAFLHQHLG
jgi:carboxymethylenebutenolidase